MALLLFLIGVSESVFVVLGCASMLVSVTFYVGMRGDWMLLIVVILCGIVL